MLTMSHPVLLWTVPLAVLAVLLASRAATRPLSSARRIASFAVRALLVAALGLALARPAATLRAERPHLTVFLADVSGSVPREAWDSGVGRLRRAWASETAAGNRCALLAFAGRPELLVPPGSSPLDADLSILAHRSALGGLKSESPERFAALRDRLARLRVDETDLPRALEAARSLFEEGATNRVVLLTDARGPQGGPPPALPPGSLVVPLDPAARPDAAVVRVDAPVAVRSGEPFDVRVTLESSAPAEIALALAVDDRVVPESARRVRVAAGRAVVVLENVQQKRALAPGVHRLLVTLPADDEPRNNLGAAAFTVTGKPRVLLVEGSPGEAEPLARMLQAQDIEFTRAGTLPAALEEHVAVVLAGVPREALPAEAVAALSAYVERLGGGLWVVGSPALAGASGYAGTALEKLLPVRYLESPASPTASKPPQPPPPAPPQPLPPDTSGTPKKVLAPSVAMLLLVDKSGSMAGDPIEIVKEACIAAAEALSRKDTVAVLAFDGRPRPVLEFTEADRKDYIRDRVRRLFADGPTHIQPALLEAHRAFMADPRARRAAAKHVILLSDGDTLPADFETVVRRMAEDGITVSTVCVEGPKFDPGLMSQIADWGKGRFFFAPSFKKVPQIFVQEAKKVLEGLPKEEKPPPAGPPDPPPAPPAPPPVEPRPEAPRPQAVAVKDPHEVLQGLAGRPFPPVEGKLASAARQEPGVVVPLVAADGQPVLALRRAGLGKAAAWTPDFAGPWSASWRAWPEAGKLVAQLVRWLSASTPDTELAGRIRVTIEGREAVLRVDAGAPAEALSARDPASGDALPLVTEPDGSRLLRVPLERAGEARRVLLQREDGRGLLVGAVRASDPEFLPSPEGPAVLSGAPRVTTWPELEKSPPAARMSADRRVDLSPWLVLAVLVLLPLDVAVRRYSA